MDLIAGNEDTMKKPRLGFFKYSCCSGCEFAFIFFQQRVLESLAGFEFVYCRMVSSAGAPAGPFDLALVEGTITEAWQVDELKKIRDNSRFLYAIGSCATNGGIPAIKATGIEQEIEKRVYRDLSTIHSIRPNSLAAYIRVDGDIRGCPPSDHNLHEVLTSMILGKEPNLPDQSVCMECKMAGNICLLTADNKPCMGPVTSAGCGALCPSYDRACYSCWGPMKQANTMALAKRFEAMGLSPSQIVRRFTLFGAETLEYRKVREHYED
jgi:sulfhydrogenase subunit delta